MSCVRCEVTRAKIKANLLALIGATPCTIAEVLNDEQMLYYVWADNEVYRKNLLPPYTPHFIYRKGS